MISFEIYVDSKVHFREIYRRSYENFSYAMAEAMEFVADDCKVTVLLCTSTGITVLTDDLGEDLKSSIKVVNDRKINDLFQLCTFTAAHGTAPKSSDLEEVLS